MEQRVPVAGVRYGKLGFLATFSPDQLNVQMPKIFDGCLSSLSSKSFVL